MPMHDRQIPAEARCQLCEGAGWRWWSPAADSGEESRWIVCRECLGTGRADKKGRKRSRPEDPDG